MADKLSQSRAGQTPFDFEPKDISLAQPLVDPNNYRFLDKRKFKKKAATRFHEDSVQRATLDSLEQSYQLDELKHSILTNGYVPMERLIVVPYAARTGYFVVVEGNTGSIVEGYIHPQCREEVKFQNALHKVTASDFEKLAAVILKIIGCHTVFFTPSSHDQGVDAFGYQKVVSPTPYGITHQLTWIAQAKHYKGMKVGSGDVRELVGSKELLVAKVFSTVDVKYKELLLKAYAPTAIALMTTEEIPYTVRKVAEQAGIYVFAASDLFHILRPHLKKKTAGAIRSLISREAKLITTLS